MMNFLSSMLRDEVSVEPGSSSPVNRKHLHFICTMLGQCLRCWADVVHMLYNCSVFAGSLISYVFM